MAHGRRIAKLRSLGEFHITVRNFAKILFIYNDLLLNEGSIFKCYGKSVYLSIQGQDMGGFKEIFKMFGSKAQEPVVQQPLVQQPDFGPNTITVNGDLPSDNGGNVPATIPTVTVNVSDRVQRQVGSTLVSSENSPSHDAPIPLHTIIEGCIDFIDRLRLLLDSRPTYKFGSDGMLVVDFMLGSENNAIIRIEPGKGVPVAGPASGMSAAGAYFAQVHGPYFAYDYRKELPAVERCNAIGEVLNHIAHHAATFEPNKAAQIQTLKDAVMADLTGRGLVIESAAGHSTSNPTTIGPLDILGIRGRDR